jgi:polysaccharide export outer membrane protein
MRQFLFLIPVLACPLGCTHWRQGTIQPTELDPGLQAHAPPLVKPLQLANLGAPTHPRYMIQPGDLLDVSVMNLAGENQASTIPARVANDGTICLPLVGPVPVAYLTVPEAEGEIFAAYDEGAMLHLPQVSVNVHESRKVRVFLLGAVKNPGQYELAGNESDLLSALMAAGGLTNDADPIIEVRRRITSRRPALPRGPHLLPAGHEQAPPPDETDDADPDAGTTAGAQRKGSPYGTYAVLDDKVVRPAAAPGSPVTLIRFDLNEEQGKSMLSSGFTLKNGDTISVQERKTKPIYVMGMVNKPGDLSIPPDRAIRVLDAVGMAGGVDKITLPDKAVVIRQRPDDSGVVAIRIDLDKAKRELGENILLAPGDVVSVEETPASYARGIFREAFRLGLGVTAAPSYGF